MVNTKIICFINFALLSAYCAKADQEIVTSSDILKDRKEKINQFEKNNIKSIINEYSDAVVLIYSISNKAEDDGLIYSTKVKPRLKKHHYKVGVSSGVLISQDGIICTTYSSVMNADTFVVSVNSEFRAKVNDNKIVIGADDFKAEIIKLIPNLNLAFLRIKPRDNRTFHYVKLGNDTAMINGKNRILLNSSLVIGKAKGESFVNVIKPANSNNNFSVFVAGIEQLYYKKEQGIPMLLALNTSTNPGIIPETEGGAVLNKDGKLIGIASPQLDQFGNIIQCAIPVSTIKQAINIALPPNVFQIKNTEPLGITLSDDKSFKISTSLRKLLKIPSDIKNLGVRVKSVILQSIADKAGIQPGDIILMFNDEVVTNEEILKNLEKISIKFQTIPIKILRQKSILELELYK